MATENRQQDQSATPGLSSRGAARRRWTRAGAAGALLTLGSRGALAASPSCLTPSGYWSNGLSPANSHYGHQTCTGGMRPDQWVSSASSWPSKVPAPSTAFTSVLPLPNGAQCPAPASASTSSSTKTGGGDNGNGKDKGKGNDWKAASTTTDQPAAPTSYECATLLDILQGQGFDGGQLGQYMAAAYLNAAAGSTPFLTTVVLNDMWRDIMSSGVYHPTAGVDWTRTDVVTYLQSTMA